MLLDLDDTDFYAGVSGVTLEGPGCDLGEGLYIRPTFAHLMAPFLLAFAPAEPGKPHPAPWRAVAGGLALDIQAEIFIPQGFALSEWFDRLNTIWWITALLRLKGTQLVRIPVVASAPYRQIPSLAENSVRFWTIEADGERIRLQAETPSTVITKADLEWLRSHWLQAGRIAHHCEPFNLLMQAFSAAPTTRSPALAMLSMWAALEGLFSPARNELKFRVSSLIASYLEEPGEDRRSLQREIAKLYDARSASAHTGSAAVYSEAQATYELVRRILLRIVAAGTAPTHESLEARLFGSA